MLKPLSIKMFRNAVERRKAAELQKIKKKLIHKQTKMILLKSNWHWLPTWSNDLDIYWNNFIHTIKIVYNGHPWEGPEKKWPSDGGVLVKVRFTVDRQLLNYIGCCWQGVVVWRWSLRQVWLFRTLTPVISHHFILNLLYHL